MINRRMVWWRGIYLFLQLRDLICVEDLGCAIYVFDLLSGLSYSRVWAKASLFSAHQTILPHHLPTDRKLA